jgi:uncharacterized protein YdhG (YjbR/CyaY superfamily)
MTEIDDFLNTFPEKQAQALLAVRNTLRTLLPSASEDMSWGMPTFRIDTVIVTSLCGFQKHNSLFPGPEIQSLLGRKLDGYTTTKGTIHFDEETPLPEAFLKAVVRARITVINSGFPKKSGEFKEFYPNGMLKTTGKYKDNLMSGYWVFFRQDGTKKRSGSFIKGKQTRQWVTYDATGAPYKTTNFS